MHEILEWLNYNSIRRYPLHEAGIVNNVLSDDVIVDANITIPENIPMPVFVSSIMVNNAICSVGIKDGNNNTIGVATGVLSDNYYNTLYIEPLIDIISGVIIVGKGTLGIPTSHGMQRHNFTAAEGELETRTITKTTSSVVTSITVNGIKLQGDIKLRAGNGIRLRYDEVTPNCIVAELENPNDLIPECLQDCNPEKCNNAILTINGVTPDASGNINITGDGAVQPENDATNSNVTIATPQLGVQDFCDKDVGKPGDPGPPGDPGDRGPDGILVCGANDCLCQVCDNNENQDAIDDCDVILPS